MAALGPPGGGPVTLPALLRVGVLAALAGALVVPAPRAAAPEGGRVVRLTGGAAAARDVGALLVGAPPALLVRAAEQAPGTAEMDALAAAAARAPLLARLPQEASWLEARPPQEPAAGRAAAIPFRLRAAPGDSVWVRLEDEAGPADSLRVAAGPDGVAEGAFRVRPPRAGWREWTVEAAGRTTRTGAWVAEAAAPRVRVVAGPPSWETRFLVRALEESGAEVTLSQPLGRGLEVRQGDGGVPVDAAALTGVDAVLVLPGADPSPRQLAALAEYASRRGGGVLLVGAGAAGPLRVAGGGAAAEVSGDRVAWTLPAELAALPGDRVRTSATTVGSPLPGAVAGAALPEGTLLALRPAGRGRIAALGLTETWRWRMEAGRTAEHREFWRSLVDWLASAPRGEVRVEVEEPLGPVGAVAEVRVYPAGEEGAPAPRLTLTRPDGGAEPLPLSPDPSRPGVLRARFAADRAGPYRLSAGEGSPAAGFRAGPDAASPEPWARLALLAARSGGAALPPADFDAEVARREAALPAPDGAAPPWRWILLGAAAALAVAEWTLRRLRGRA